jgi:hypothetical protein
MAPVETERASVEQINLDATELLDEYTRELLAVIATLADDGLLPTADAKQAALDMANEMIARVASGIPDFDFRLDLLLERRELIQAFLAEL